MADNGWTVKPLAAPNVHQITFDVEDTEWEQYVLLTGDRHHDNLHSRRDLQKKHLDLAVERNAPIIDIGDWHDAMGGREDRRRSMDFIRPEHKESDNYFDLLLDDTEAFFAPYARHFAVIGTGNHESAVRKRGGIDLTSNTARRLRQHSGEDWPFAGGYGGYVRLQFSFWGGARSQSMLLKYYHGSGGGGPVTKGVIQTNRRAVYLPDADIIATGHIHEAWVVPITRERCSQRGAVRTDIQWHIQVPTYKDEYGTGESGWHIETGKPPKPVGAVWLRFGVQRKRVVVDATLDVS